METGFEQVFYSSKVSISPSTKNFKTNEYEIYDTFSDIIAISYSFMYVGVTLLYRALALKIEDLRFATLSKSIFMSVKLVTCFHLILTFWGFFRSPFLTCIENTKLL